MEEVDVLVVGGGPTGLTVAHLCDQAGLSCAVLERRDGPQRSPAAHAVNARTFEVWRQAGVAMQPILAQASDPADAGWVHWVTRLGGEVIGSLPYERQGDEMYDITPTPLRNLSQHRLEPLLALADGDLRYGHTWSSATEEEDSVISQIAGPDGTYLVRSRYLLGADGASSLVRKWLDIEPIGPRTIESFVMVHFRGDLRPIVADHPAVLYFVSDPASGGVFVAHDIDTEWVYMRAWDPDEDPAEAFTPERSAELVRAAMEDDINLEILGTTTWHMSAQVAEHYRRGRTFLVGDAAHRFPPTGGLGLNTGVADAHNLMWKLAAVEAGWASRSLLDTYEQERRPVAEFNAEQSLTNALKLVEVPIALGHSDDVDTAVRAMHDTLADPEGRARVEAAIADQAVHFDLLGLQLGHGYETGAVVPDGTLSEPLEDPARDYVPSTRPGGRLPHGWLDDGRSTLDLIDPVVPTVLHSEAQAVTLPAGGTPAVVASCPESVWSNVFDLPTSHCLLVRPDQHIAFRGPTNRVVDALADVLGS